MLSLAILALSVHALVGNTGHFGIGMSYGRISNFKQWDAASTETGSMLAVAYSYAFNDFYTAALELGFIVDDNVLKKASVDTYVETGTFLNIDHIFHTRKIGPLSPYFKIGTGISAVNGWWKQNDLFYINANNIFADLSAGLGADFKLWNALINVDLSFPALAHTVYLGGKLAYILSFGYRYQF